MGMNIFSMNSSPMRGIRKIVELMYLGILWFLCSVPIITLGAATAALYEVLLKAVKDREGYLTGSFFRAFRDDLGQGIRIWLPIMAAQILFAVNLFYYAVLGGGNFPVQTVVFSLLLGAGAALFSYVFPVMARFENTAMGHVRVAAALAIRNPGWTLVLAAIWTLTLFLIWFFVYIPLLFVMGLSGYVQAVILDRIFERAIERGMIRQEGQNSDL